jgi:hypothetical protein
MTIADWIIAVITVLAALPFLLVMTFGGYLVVDEMLHEIKNRIESWKN